MKGNYHSLIRTQAGLPEPEDEKLDNEVELKAYSLEIKLLSKQTWHKDAITQELFNDLSSQIGELEKRARELACSYSSNQNHLEIISLLVRSSELRKLNKHYGIRG